MYDEVYPKHEEGDTLQQHSHQLPPCPPSPFDLILRHENGGSQQVLASPFNLRSAPGRPSAPLTPAAAMAGGTPRTLNPSSPLDLPNPNGRVQQLLANSNINMPPLGRPPPSPFDLPPSGRGARSPFDVALGQRMLPPAATAPATTSSGSGGTRPGGGGGGGLSFAGARSMERSLGSEGSPGTSLGADAGDDLSGIAQPNVEQHQQHFVRYSGLPEAHPMPEWRGQDSFAAEAAAFGEIDLKSRSERMPLTLSMRVISAPASFALPMVQRKVFKPPFMVRLEVQYRGDLSLPVTLEAHVINDAAHSKVATWLPQSEKMQAELEGNRISRTLNVTPMSYVNGLGLDVKGQRQEAQEHLHLEDFKFPDLKWAKSSRMSKRWIIFSLRIKDDVVFLLYKLPTVVISRRTDQYSKAHELLTGVSAAAVKRPRTAPMFASTASVPQQPSARDPGGPPEPPRLAHCASVPEGALADASSGPPIVDSGYISHWIHLRYQACGFMRYLSDSDMKALMQQAGTYVGKSGITGRDSLPVDPVKWEAFRGWFVKGLKTLQLCQKVWDTTRPHAICGFAVDRAAAEALLAEQPVGTFLVRTCSEAGAFSISCCMDGLGGHPFVDHLLVDAVDLHTRCLEAWVHAHQHALQLLDPLSDKLFPKEAIFRQPHDAEHLVKGTPPQTAPAEAGPRLQLPAVAPPLPAAANNLSMDHLLMLANLTGGGGLDWNSTAPPQGQALDGGNGGGNSPAERERELSLDVLGNLDLQLASGQRAESLGQRLESLSRLDLHSGSIDGLSRALLGSLGNVEAGERALLGSLGNLPECDRALLGSLGILPEGDASLRDMLPDAADLLPAHSLGAVPSASGPLPSFDMPPGQDIAGLGMMGGWGSLSDMGLLGPSYCSIDSEQVGIGRSLEPAMGFDPIRGDVDMEDAPSAHTDFHKGMGGGRPYAGSRRFGNGLQQMYGFSTDSDAFWDPIVEPQPFRFGQHPFGSATSNGPTHGPS